MTLRNRPDFGVSRVLSRGLGKGPPEVSSSLAHSRILQEQRRVFLKPLFSCLLPPHSVPFPPHIPPAQPPSKESFWMCLHLLHLPPVLPSAFVQLFSILCQLLTLKSLLPLPLPSVPQARRLLAPIPPIRPLFGMTISWPSAAGRMLLPASSFSLLAVMPGSALPPQNRNPDA